MALVLFLDYCRSDGRAPAVVIELVVWLAVRVVGRCVAEETNGGT